ETVVGQCAAAAQRHCPGADVNGRRRIERQAHAVTGDLVVAKLLRVEVAQACDHGIAKRTGREGSTRFDQGDRDTRIGLLEGAGEGGPGETPTDDDDTRISLRDRGGMHEGRRGAGSGDAEKLTTTDV